MADIDTLPPRGIRVAALVDGNGVATNGSQTTAQLAARGMRSECAVDATGVSTSGANMLQIGQRGFRAFCPVNELGIAQDATTTAATLRQRGIRPVVLLDANGIALNGSANIATLAQRGLQSFCPLDETGNATTLGAVILVSNTTVLDNATIGTTVGTLSVAGGSGTYTFTLTSNPGSLFATAGTNGVNLNTAVALTAGDKPITVQAAGGVPTPISRALVITVAPSPTLPANTVLPVISGSTVVGQTLTTTDGTWTGFPAPAYTYQWQRNPAVVTDPYFANVKLLMGFEGTNGAITGPGFADESGAAHGAATNNSASISTSQFVFGSSSLACSGTNSYLTYPDSADWNLAAGSFTIEFRVRHNNGTLAFLFGQWQNAPTLGWMVYLNAGVPTFNLSTTGSDNIVQITGSSTLTTNTWYALCVDFDGTKYRMYVNGTMIGSSTTLRTIFDSSQVLAIGSSSAGGNYLAGNLDELRLTKGAARYASDSGYTAATSTFPRS